MNPNIQLNQILQLIHPLKPEIKRMLGCNALILNNKIILLIRDQELKPEFNGVFIATEPPYFEALQKEIHTSHMEVEIDGMDHSWIFLSEDLEDFDAKVKLACNMLTAGDKRIGKPF